MNTFSQSKNQKIKVLLLESNPFYTNVVKELLSAGTNGISFDVECVDRISTALNLLSKGGIEIALSDLHLADSDGLSTISRLRSEAPDLPIVALLAKQDEVPGMILENGAQDYLIRDQVSQELLIRALHYALERKKSEGALKKAHAEKELLLASIGSILIGLNSNNEVTYWNGISEATFGLPHSQVIHHPFSSLKIRWDIEFIVEQIKECRTQQGAIKINDVQFLKPNMQEGFLGLTIIPIKSGDLDLLIFGADITERKTLEQLKNEFISTVSHELRTPLTVIREGVSQVLEGILGETTENQRRFLSIVLQAIDRLSRIINDLLDISKIEADKLELELDLIDLVSMVQEIVAPSSPYQLRAHNKNLVLKANLPSRRVEVYAARDKILQVFTNLIGNALKFTPKGEIEISVSDCDDYVECMVSDTGPGIAKENLSKAFNKFQQFDRIDGPGDKGTGLGLAISKGLVEMHHGRIWVESEVGRGTKFIFRLPKVESEQIFKCYISNGIKRAQQHKSSLSCIYFEIRDAEHFNKIMDCKSLSLKIEKFESAVQKNLRNKADITARGNFGVFVLLPSTNKEDGIQVAQRIQHDYDAWCHSQSVTPLDIRSRIASFPEDGKTEEELFSWLTQKAS